MVGIWGRKKKLHLKDQPGRSREQSWLHSSFQPGAGQPARSGGLPKPGLEPWQRFVPISETSEHQHLQAKPCF